jgi:uridine kinase
MLEDMLIIKNKHHQAAEQILQQLLPLNSQRTVIAVSGESGAGKSELAYVLGRKIRQNGKLVKIIHSDNYYNIAPREKTAWRQKHGVEKVGLNEYNWVLIKQNIHAFRTGAKAKMPCVDLLTDLTDELITDFKSIEYLIFEGLYAVNIEADLRVIITLTYHETKKARHVRGKEPQNEFRLQVLEQEHKVLQSLRPKADLLVTKNYKVIDTNKLKK